MKLELVAAAVVTATFVNLFSYGLEFQHAPLWLHVYELIAIPLSGLFIWALMVSGGEAK